MLAKASFSTKYFRPKFDISLPLIHSQHPLQSGSSQLDQLVSSEHLRGRLDLPYLLSFKVVFFSICNVHIHICNSRYSLR